MNIALIIDTVESEYTQKIVEGVSRVLRETSDNLIVFESGVFGINLNPYDYQNRSVLSLINEKSIDGIIFLATPHLNFTDADFLKSYFSHFGNIPIVTIGAEIEGIPSVMSTSYNSVKTLVNHLIQKHGRKRLALFAAGTDSSEAVERESAFYDALKENGIKYDKNLTMKGGYHYEEAVSSLFDHKVKYGYDFDAVVSVNDDMAFACVDEFNRNKIKIPEDIVVTGFDDDVRSYSGTPSLTTVNQNIEGQGKKACEVLLAKIAGKSYDMVSKVESRPVFRKSCGCITDESGEVTALDKDGNPFNDLESHVKFDVAEWYSQRNQFINVVKLYSSMQFDMTLEEFRNRIKNELILSGINAACICVFERPIEMSDFDYFTLPDKARLLSCYDLKSDYLIDGKVDEVVFNPREEFIPKGIFDSLDGMYVMAIYRTQFLAGYFVFRPGNYDINVYSLIHKIISNTIISSLNISNVQKANKKLEMLATQAEKNSNTDVMTGLFNRRGLLKFGQKSIDLCVELGKSGAVIFADLDGLKVINDTYGHEAGDEAIKAEAHVLKKVFRDSDVISRLGGDEFAIVAPGLKGGSVSRIIESVRKECEAYNKTSNKPFVLSVSMGWAIFTPDDETVELNQLLRKADLMLYEEKKQKKGLSRSTQP